MRGRLSIFLLVSLIGGAGQALSSPSDRAASEATFTAVADAYVSSAARGRNFGRARNLRISRRPVQRSYLRFAVRGLTAPVGRATLRVFSRSRARRGFRVHATGARWSERKVTFARAPRPGRAIASSGRLRARRWTAVDVTRLVRGNGKVNLALTGAATLASRESGSARPQLVVEPEPPAQTVVAAGDIADCNSPGDEQTAALVDGIQGTIAANGDLAYENGTPAEFAACYEPTWGRFKARTKPSLGNHEYGTPGAAGYFGYWGAVAGTPGQGWYSYDLGAWHVVVLNSNCEEVACQAGSAQEAWLRADLASHKRTCTLAYLHHPFFSSGLVPGRPALLPFWQALYDAGAEVILGAHAHNYQRWAPQTPTGAPDRERGIRQIVVGTGGRFLHRVTPSVANQEVVNDDTWGVLRLTLKARGYEWRFVPVAGRTFTDSGSGTCH